MVGLYFKLLSNSYWFNSVCYVLVMHYQIYNIYAFYADNKSDNVFWPYADHTLLDFYYY